MLEVIALDLAAHRNAEAVLANPSHGHDPGPGRPYRDTGIIATGRRGALSGLLAVAQLRRPTTRALLRELLEARGRSDLHEAALALKGCAHFSQTHP